MANPSPVVEASQRRSAALVGKDVQSLLTLLHPDFIYVNASGQVLNREQYLDQYVRAEEVQWISQVIDEPHLTEVGDTAVLTCLVHDVARYHGHDLDDTFRSTLTWIRTGHGWRCLGGQTSAIG